MSANLPAFSTLLYVHDDQVAQITLNRPERRNALNARLNQDLLAAFSHAQDDESVRTIVLTGAGKGFCAGACWFLLRQIGYSRAYQIAIEGERAFAERRPPKFKGR